MNLIIKGGRSCLYQWDSGQTVIVRHEGTIDEVHFAHKGDDRSLTVITKEIENGVEANVPNILLQSPEDVFAYLVFRDKDGRETRKAVRIPVIARPRPETYVYTETEVLNYSSLVARIDQIEQNGVSDERIAEAVADYIAKNPIDSSSNLLVVTCTEKNGALTPSHTYDQIKAWVNNGGYAVLVDRDTWYQLFDSKSNLIFERLVPSANESIVVQYIITPLGGMGRRAFNYLNINVTAEVGQTIAVKSVDKNGKPTEWEAVDMPTGGGGLDATIDGETLVFAESSTATIENETLIL